MVKINLKKTQITTIIIALIFVSILIVIGLKGKPTPQFESSNPAIVVIRLDDVQDYAFKEAQLFLLEHSQKNNIPLTLAIIPNYFGNDQQLVETVKQSIYYGSEVAVHGWNHENLTQFSLIEQKTKLQKGKNSLEAILNCETKTLVPPMFSYNNDTLKAMEEIGYEIVSGLTEFHKFGRLTEKIQSTPATVELSNFSENRWQIKNKNQILSELQKSIENYGCAVIVTHPQEFYDQGEFNPNTTNKYQEILKTISETYSFNTLQDLEISK